MPYRMLVFYQFLFLMCFNVSYCQRRLVLPRYTTEAKRYMVYLIQSSQSHPKYDAWLCGGALVRTNKVLTSAACLLDTTNIYAIAGYKKYVSTENLQKNNCTRAMKRRVIKTCVPREYNFDPSKPKIWMTLDIGVAVLERPYRSSDVLFRIMCDYAPKPIPILYHTNVIYTGLDVFALGWGFKRGRRPGDPEDYNSDTLKFTASRLVDVGTCKKSFTGMDELIDAYMLCTLESGVINDNGTGIDRMTSYNNWCRRHGKSDSTENSKRCSDRILNDTKVNTMQMNARRQVITAINVKHDGVCQNDHGGPLVAFIGVTEMVIGVMINTIYDTDYQCLGPTLHTSTACTSAIIMCMLANNPMMRRAYTNVVRQEGFEIHENNVEWADEPSDDFYREMLTRNMTFDSDETTTHLNVSAQDDQKTDVRST